METKEEKAKKSYIKNLFRIIKCNYSTVLKFEILFKLLTSIIFIPLATGGLNLTMKITGFKYLTLDNIKPFISSPITIIFFILLILYLTLITMFDITTLIVIFDQSYQGIKIKMIDAVKISIKKSLFVFNPKNILLPFFVLFLIPYLNIGISTNVISTLKLPEFIQDYINNNLPLLILSVLLFIILIVFFVNWIYSFHYIVLEKKSFRQARKHSKNLINNNYTRDILTIAITELLKFIVYGIILVTGILIIIIINKYLGKIIILESALITIIWLFIALSFIFFSATSNAISYAIIGSLYYTHKAEDKEQIENINYPFEVKDKKSNKILKITNIILFLLCLTSGTIFTYQYMTGKNILKIEYIRELEVTAHRGASIEYPENTMAAFEGAKKNGADWIELDVQQTKDGKIIVAHDSNLKRVTGVNKDVINMTYDEIKKLDAGSHFSKEFKGERIPLLEEVIEFAINNNIRLNIELKPIGKEVDFEKSVIDIIKNKKFEDRCIITSLQYKVLENIKEIDSDIKTYYVMSIAIGNITELDKADGFSVEATNVNKSLVKKIHNEGKEILVWTVNTEENIDKMIDLGVDNIITDNTTLAKELIAESKSSDLITEYIKFVESILR